MGKEPTAVIKLPSVDDILGAKEKADTYVEMIRRVAKGLQELHTQRLANGAKPDDRIPMSPPEPDGEYRDDDGNRYRTYDQQDRIGRKGIKKLLDEAEKSGLAANVKQGLDEQRS